MSREAQARLSRRERQIMEILYRLGAATVADVLSALPDPPSYSAVRALLRILEEKGHLTHRQDGARYAYAPRVPLKTARRSALRALVQNFFDGSREDLVSALLDGGAGRVSPRELDNLAELIEQARREGR
jgi:predicted transcriptional regulator